ncbi:uncharacterized protein [Littorina saxatilis]|uniref:uncharacterized protein n=1 Tax=Littorina saxatilis TaxID=31220 RepID=UPI0038B68046
MQTQQYDHAASFAPDTDYTQHGFQEAPVTSPSDYYGQDAYLPQMQGQPALSEGSALARTLAEALLINRLPTQEPTTFSGDPLTYPLWRSSFTLLIERQGVSAEEKLLYLEKYLDGPAKDAVKGLFLIRDAQAYQQALQTLEERFGSSFVVARAFREKLDAWPVIKPKDGQALRAFSDFLGQCLVASRVIGQLQNLEDQAYHKTLMSKLPDWLVRNWVRKVNKTKNEKKRYPTFEELSAFIKTEADILCEPLFSSSKSAASSTSQTASSSVPKKTSKTDHRSVDCTTRAICDKCQGPHLTMLHGAPSYRKKIPNQQRNARGPPDSSRFVCISQDARVSASGSAFATTNKSDRPVRATMIVPVRVSTKENPTVEHTTYALLDTMSCISFVTESLSDKLNTHSEPASLRLNTMTSQNTHIECQRVTGLCVKALNSNVSHNLKTLYTTDHLTNDTENIPTSETARNIKHLSHIASEIPPLLEGCTPGLLIGYDHAELFMPERVIKGDPYAVLTPLGWTILGQVSPKQSVHDVMHVSLTEHCLSEYEGESVTSVYRTTLAEPSISDALHVMERTKKTSTKKTTTKKTTTKKTSTRRPVRRRPQRRRPQRRRPQRRRKWLLPQRNLAVGDVVVLRDEAVCRADWPLGLVTEVRPSDDGLVRTCKLKTVKVTSKTSHSTFYYWRPISKLTVLVKADPDTQ